MYRLGTSDVWWSVARNYPEMVPAEGQILKPLGHANVLDFFSRFRPSRVLEIGHGSYSASLNVMHDQAECWGIDSYDKEKTVPTAALADFRTRYPSINFVSGFVGESSEQLPDSHFDLAFSVSVIEHVPEKDVPAFHKDVFRILRPGGVMLHSFDVWWGRETRYMFDAIETAGFEWLEPRAEMCVPWEPWLTSPGPEKMEQLFRTLTFEHPHVVHEVFSFSIARSERTTHNWCTILIGCRKPT